MREEKRPDGVMFAVAGTTRYGKTTWLMNRIKTAPRGLVWDPRGEYVAIGYKLVRSLPELARLLRDAWDGPAKLAYFGKAKDFEVFAELAYNWIQVWPAVVVVEEIADVTGSGAGRGAWGELVRKGLYYGAHIYAVTIRPQETDKTTWSNATVKHCHFFDLPRDCEYMANVMGVSPEEISSLKKLEYIERMVGSKTIVRGRVKKKIA